jgi:hypothetical protein
MASLDKRRLENCWILCQAILAHFASFSISAHRSLKLLQKVHADVMSRVMSGEITFLLLLVHDTFLTRAIDKDRPPPSRSGTRPLDPMENTETVSIRQELGVAHSQDMPLDLGSGFQWQFPGGIDSDMFGGGSLFNWDQSLDVIAGGFGMDIYQ